MGRLRVLVWHVHGSWTSAFVRGPHRYLLPAVRGGGPLGRGLAGRDWPHGAVEVAPEVLRHAEVDVVVLQRAVELELAERWLGRRPGTDLPAVYVEHNTPRGNVPATRHLLAGRADIPIVHVTHFNHLMWDNGRAPTAVVPHGVVDPGHRYTGHQPRVAVLINEPVRRWRITGTDLLPAFAAAAPLDVFGIGVEQLAGRLDAAADRINPVGDLGPDQLAGAMASRRVYLHTARWTSLGLSLIEAMHLGMPVVGLASTEAVLAVPPEAGVLSTDVAELVDALAALVDQPELAHRMGKAAREYATVNYGLGAFLDRWNALLDEAAPARPVTSRRR